MRWALTIQPLTRTCANLAYFPCCVHDTSSSYMPRAASYSLLLPLPICHRGSIELFPLIRLMAFPILLLSLLISLLQNRPLFQAICLGNLWARDNRWLLSRVQRLAGSAGGGKAFCPGWRHQPGQNGGILSRLVAPTGTKDYAGILSRLVSPIGTKGPSPRWPG